MSSPEGDSDRRGGFFPALKCGAILWRGFRDSPVFAARLSSLSLRDSSALDSSWSDPFRAGLILVEEGFPVDGGDLSIAEIVSGSNSQRRWPVGLWACSQSGTHRFSQGAVLGQEAQHLQGADDGLHFR